MPWREIQFMLQSLKWGENSVYDFISALFLFVTIIIVCFVLQGIAAWYFRFSQRTRTSIDDVLIELLKNIRPPLYVFVALYFSLQKLTLSEQFVRVTNVMVIIVVVLELIHLIERSVNFFIKQHLRKTKKDTGADEHSEQMSRMIRFGLKIILAIFGFMLILSNIGVNVTSLLAGLGIGGIAIALAVQNILSDVFSSLSIYIDRPFKVGDFIVAGKEMGTVEKIGLKSTRLRSLQGEEIIISNQELTNTRLQNFKTMKRRRVVLNFGVSYHTKSEILRKIPVIIQNIIENIEGLKFDRCHFIEFGESSLNFEVVYHVESGKFRRYIDTKQDVHLAIMQVFKKHSIDFAYPTQVILYDKLRKSRE